MYFVNSRKKINFSFLTIIFVLFVAFSIDFGAIITSANSEKDEQRQRNTSSLQAVQDEFLVSGLKESRLSFLAEDLTSVTTEQPTKPLLDNLLSAGDLDPTFGSGGKVTTPISTNGI
ncbi:MAG: hypothetical protein H0X72_01625 [Acidobacteria bacterium]|jgi:hypothetical protein|nr:hypothetical protein [Acidobacteriota bacterium]